jgi:hypothetical protein
MGVLFSKGVAQDCQTMGAFAELLQPEDNRIAVQWSNLGMVDLDPGPVNIGIVHKLYRTVLSQQ